MAIQKSELNDDSVPQGFLRTAQYAIKEFGLLGTASRYLSYKNEQYEFLAKKHQDHEQRKYLQRKFATIQREVPCAHSPAQFYLLTDLIMGVQVPGPIVECGVFKGGSAAKLSLIAKATGRELYLCDSYSGLPQLTTEDSKLSQYFRKGQFVGQLDEVRSNIEKYGDISVCHFVVGYFQDSLPKLKINPAIVFEDVDLISSVRDCLKNLWPQMPNGAYWFTHEACLVDYLRGMMDAKWWREELGTTPPMLIGGGSGLSMSAPSIAYFIKED
jgi:O-methyltransferase